MAPMKVKNGMASSSSFDRMLPNTRPGMACMNDIVKKPISIDRKPKKKPTAASEKATG
ncbi:hypothetical protein D3C83_167570 [compost metagenome]